MQGSLYYLDHTSSLFHKCPQYARLCCDVNTLAPTPTTTFGKFSDKFLPNDAIVSSWLSTHTYQEVFLWASFLSGDKSTFDFAEKMFIILATRPVGRNLHILYNACNADSFEILADRYKNTSLRNSKIGFYSRNLLQKTISPPLHTGKKSIEELKMTEECKYWHSNLPTPAIVEGLTQRGDGTSLIFKGLAIGMVKFDEKEFVQLGKSANARKERLELFLVAFARLSTRMKRSSQKMQNGAVGTFISESILYGMLLFT